MVSSLQALLLPALLVSLTNASIGISEAQLIKPEKLITLLRQATKYISGWQLTATEPPVLACATE